MVSVYVSYEDGKDIACSHIAKISYVSYEKIVDVPEEELCSHLFPIGVSLWLHSNDGISVINGNGLRSINIRNE